jgi:hypothetical protein
MSVMTQQALEESALQAKNLLPASWRVSVFVLPGRILRWVGSSSYSNIFPTVAQVCGAIFGSTA